MTFTSRITQFTTANNVRIVRTHCAQTNVRPSRWLMNRAQVTQFIRASTGMSWRAAYRAAKLPMDSNQGIAVGDWYVSRLGFITGANACHIP